MDTVLFYTILMKTREIILYGQDGRTLLQEPVPEKTFDSMVFKRLGQLMIKTKGAQGALISLSDGTTYEVLTVR